MKNKIIDIIVSTVTTIIIVFVVMAISSYFKNGSLLDKPAVETATAIHEDKNIDSSGSIAIPGYEKLVMKAGQLTQNIELFNPEENECYMVIEILSPNGTRLYKTGMLEPGKGIDKFEISRELEIGTYEGAILKYSNYDLMNMQELNGAETNFILEVIP